MSFQPPPPGGTPPPPPPPSGQWGPPPGNMGGAGGPGNYPSPGPGFDPKTVNPLDWGILAAGALAFIFSLFDYYTADAGFVSASESSFGDGFFGWFAALLALAATVIVALALFAKNVKLPVPPRLIALGLFAVAFVCSLITMFINPTDVPDQYFGHGFGYWASFILIIVATVLSLMRFQQGGGKLPGALGGIPNIGHHGPQGGHYGPPATGGMQQPPQAPQYGAPQPGQGPQAGNNPPPPPPGYGPPQ